MTMRRWVLTVVIAAVLMIASMGTVSAQNFLGQGFDKCEIPTLSEMQNWITNSPYGAVNLYIGGSCRSCPNSALSASYVSQLSQQGWTFIPTWVGPQSAGWGGGSCGSISNDPTTAYNQGVSEANAAIDVAIELGLALADGSGTIIYYDLENYDTTNAIYRNAAKSFISGWTAQIHARGSQAGVYGSSCGSEISDFASISNVPDAIWPAHWLTPYQYRSDATVEGVACLLNDLWGNHQRIRQYAGGHSETWGGVTLTIDSNVIDGIVAYSLPTISDKSLIRVDTQNEVYWLQNGKLYWITDWDVINQMSGIPGWAGDSVNILPISVFNPVTYPHGPMFISTEATSSGLLLCELGQIDVYLISDGEKHRFTSPEIFESEGYNWDDIIKVSSQIIQMFPTGSDIGADFTISASPSSQSIVQCSPTTYNISLTSLNGFNSAVSLSATGLPAGVTASFSPSSVTPTSSSTLNIQTSTSTPPGSYQLTINSIGGGKTHTSTATLIVSATSGIVGDINGDGSVTSVDALMVLQMTVGNLAETSSADINGDGSVTSVDALMILQAVVGNILL